MAETPINILLITTDQQRADAMGCAGNPLIRTPTLDRLASQGARFDRCYTPSPVCVPARFSLVTGLLPHRNGCCNNGAVMDPDLPTMPGILSESGYVTHAVGKMHFTPPRRSFGFQSMELSEEIPGALEDDDFLSFLQGKGFSHVHEPHGVRGEMYYIPQVSQLPAELHTTAWTANRAAHFLRAHDQRKPFFLWVSFIKPHPPFDPPVPWNKLYRTVDMPRPFRPEGFADMQTWWMRHQNRYKYRESGPDDTLARTIRAAYYACISFIDDHLGQVLRVLKLTGMADRTLVVFTSDHGELLGDYGSWGKRSFLDPSARVPLIVRWPGHVAPSTVVGDAVSLVDIMPTAMAAAGIDPAPYRLDGVPLTEREPGRRVYGQLDSGQKGTYMVTDGHHKYFYSSPDAKEFLFDLTAGAYEVTNLAGDPGAAPVLQSLRASLLTRLRRDGHTEPVAGDQWQRYPPPGEPADPDADRIFQPAVWTDPWPRTPGYVPDWVPRPR